MNSEFKPFFISYLEQAKAARDQNKHHDFRRGLFLEFLHNAFQIEQADIEIEKYIQLEGQQISLQGTARITKGWIDAIFHDVIFEFKRNLKIEEAEGLRELRAYLSALPNGEENIGLLTDGIVFIAYVLNDDKKSLRKIDSINLEAVDANAVYLWLDAYLLRQSNVPPTSADIVRRFGLFSPTFVATARLLHLALRTFAVNESGAFEVKRQQWAFHLARVYGSVDIGNEEMFIRHTYLCQFAKILAYVAQFGVGKATEEIEHILDGKAFEVLGINNIGEYDFFSWVLSSEVKGQMLDAFRHIVTSLIVYNLSRIDEDLLKQLYQNLVEPETRHELGEFYTPDWLAELTLQEINYQPGQSILDPACGSGTFLFTAIRMLSEKGITGQELVDFAFKNIMGVDVHPLAVTIAKVNYMLAILPHMRKSIRRTQYAIPITMANSLQEPIKSDLIEVIKVPFTEKEAFHIPVEAARHPEELSEVLDAMGRYAEHAATLGAQAKFAEFGEFAVEKLQSDPKNLQSEQLTWNANVRRLTNQISAGRDSIWIYLLNNTSRPLFLRYRKFDVIVGNPPWIAYRYIKDATYQSEIKKLTQQYGLLESRETKLNTTMDLATLFFEHCRKVYLKPEGTIGFVMPRSVITGAKQHRAFQKRGFTRILDFKDVEPLFNVETCVIINERNSVSTQAIPTKNFAGILPSHECSLREASRSLTKMDTSIDFTEQEMIASPYYHSRFNQGASLVPRNLVFVTSSQENLTPGQLAHISIMHTDPELNNLAKQPWKGIHLQGHIDGIFLYATLLSTNLLPFGVRKFHLVALPIQVGKPKRMMTVSGKGPEEIFKPVSLEEMRNSFIWYKSAEEWFAKAEKLWGENKKKTTKETLAQWTNYQNKIVKQSAMPQYLLITNTSGTKVTAALINTADLPIINGNKPQGFVADFTTYWYQCSTKEEGYYLSAILNAPSVDQAIKKHQPRGLFGARHITRLPFEVCSIPPFNPDNEKHQQLVSLSQAAHEKTLEHSAFQGGISAARKRIRQETHPYIEQIDIITRQLLNLPPAPALRIEQEEQNEIDELV